MRNFEHVKKAFLWTDLACGDDEQLKTLAFHYWLIGHDRPIEDCYREALNYLVCHNDPAGLYRDLLLTHDRFKPTRSAA